MDLILSTPCFVYVFAINICCCITVQITQLSLSISLHECTLHVELLSLQADITIAWLSSHQSKTNEWPIKQGKHVLQHQNWDILWRMVYLHDRVKDMFESFLGHIIILAKMWRLDHYQLHFPSVLSMSIVLHLPAMWYNEATHMLIQVSFDMTSSAIHRLLLCGTGCG